MTSHTPQVEFWFDPICPWAWRASRWATEVSVHRGFQIVWHPVSLKILNEGNPESSHAELMEAGLRLGRVIVAAEQLYGQEVVGRLYTALGTRIHDEGRTDFEHILTEALGEAELSGQADLAAADDSFDVTLRANTHHATDIAGPDVGVPVISIDGVAFFGPVIDPSPTGALALQLWDGIYAAASVPGFYELKRGRS